MTINTNMIFLNTHMTQ